MSATEIATFIALLLNAAAIIVVAYQTWLTRKALQATDRSVRLSIKTMQVEMLPTANWVISVRADLECWIEDLQLAVKNARKARKKSDAGLIRTVAGGGLASPHGLVRKFSVDHMPGWLSTIWLTGAQYYYDSKAMQSFLWSEADNMPPRAPALKPVDIERMRYHM